MLSMKQEAAHLLHIPYNLAVRVYEGMDEKLLRRSLEYILEDGSGGRRIYEFALYGGDAGCGAWNDARSD